MDRKSITADSGDLQATQPEEQMADGVQRFCIGSRIMATERHGDLQKDGTIHWPISLGMIDGRKSLKNAKSGQSSRRNLYKPRHRYDCNVDLRRSFKV